MQDRFQSKKHEFNSNKSETNQPVNEPGCKYQFDFNESIETVKIMK